MSNSLRRSFDEEKIYVSDMCCELLTLTFDEQLICALDVSCELLIFITEVSCSYS